MQKVFLCVPLCSCENSVLKRIQQLPKVELNNKKELKNRIHRKIILIASVCCLLGSGRLAAETVVIEQDSQGNYIIDSEAKLAQFAQNVNDGISYSGETIILPHDIVLSTVKYPKTNHTPIGMYGKPFLGTLDGQGHQIMNLQVNSDYYAGLFGYIGAGGVVKNLTISSMEVRVNKGDEDYMTCFVGGIVGYNEGTIVGCANRGVTVYGNVSNAYVGGIAGENTGSILNCYNLGRVYTSSNSGNYLGGIVGENASSGTIRNCFVRASIDEGNKATRNHPICANNQAATANISGCFYMNGVSTDNYVNLSLDNSSTNDLSSFNNEKKNVLLKDRILYSDGAWNTFCVPFNIPAGASDESPIAGATVMELDKTNSNFNPLTGVLTLYFIDATTIQAGLPYIIKWDEAIDGNLSNPVFLGVTVEDKSATERAVTTNDGHVTFQGIFDALSITEKDESILYLGAANTLYYPNEAMTIGSCRAYFKLNGTSKARFCILNLGDSETTSIHERPFTQRDDEADTWFSLDGRRLNGKPKQCGVYINNGRKVVVK